MTEQFKIKIHGEVKLSITEIWPDGDAPDNPTIEDILKKLHEKPLVNIMREWNLGDYFNWSVNK